jgi:hypothetical protein
MRLLLEATSARKLQWERVHPDTYEARVEDNSFLIVIKYPLLAGDDGSDADIAEVHVPGLTLTFYNGTEGFDLAMQVLAAGVPERAHGPREFHTRADRAIYYLETLLQQQSPPGTT